jgi:hypothetical protein
LDRGFQGYRNRVIADLDAISVKQLLLHAITNRLWGLVHKRAVGTDIFQGVSAATTDDLCVVAGHEFVRVRQYPVIIEGAPDRTTLGTKYPGAIGAKRLTMKARHAKRQSHPDLPLCQLDNYCSVLPSIILNRLALAQLPA